MPLAAELEAYYARFYVLSESSKRGAMRVRTVDGLERPEALTRAEAMPQVPVRFEHSSGKRPLDLMGTTWAVVDLVSDRFVAALENRGLTGWTTYPVAVSDADGRPLSGYHGLAVTGRCGPIDDALSPRVILPPPVPEGRTAEGRRGLLFELGSWDGTDVFCSPRRATIFVSNRVVDALTADAITNVEFRRTTDIERTWNADGSLLL